MRIDWPDNILSGGEWLCRDQGGNLVKFYWVLYGYEPIWCNNNQRYFGRGETLWGVNRSNSDYSFLPQEWWDLPHKESLIQKPKEKRNEPAKNNR